MTDLSAVKARSKVVWGSGNYLTVGSRLVLLAEDLCESVPVKGGQRVLDIATGTGNAALAAARRFATVSAVDFVAQMVERGRQRAAAEGLEIDFREGDAEALDFPDESFDVVLSTCGVMFAPDQERAAAEMLRVCRPGGSIGMVNWTPEGLVGAMFKAFAALNPPPAGVNSALRWGTLEGLRQLFGDKVSIDAPVKNLWWRMPSLDDWVAFFAPNFGPAVTLASSLGEDGPARVETALREAAAPYNRAKDGTAIIQQDYREVVIRKPA